MVVNGIISAVWATMKQPLPVEFLDSQSTPVSEIIIA